MITESRIVQIAKYDPSVNKAVREHCAASFEGWQEADLSCSPEYEARDWFAHAELSDAAQDGVATNYSI